MGFFDPLIIGGLHLLGSSRTGADAAGARVAFENFRAGIAPDREDEIRMARTRWLERNGSIASFTCGVGALAPDPGPDPDPDPWGERDLEPVPVTVAVTATEFVYLREGNEEDELIVEVGRFPREAFADTRLVDADGRPVAAPAGEVFEPAATCELIVRWRTPDGAHDEDGFVFRSLSVAAEAGERFRRFAIVPSS